MQCVHTPKISALIYLSTEVFRSNVDCSQPSLFSYFYLIIKRKDRVASELDASAKRNAYLGTPAFVLLCFSFTWVN